MASSPNTVEISAPIVTSRRTNPEADFFSNNAGLRLTNEDGQGINRFGVVRDRLFQAMLFLKVKFALFYNRNVPQPARRLLEFIALINAISLFGLLICIHNIVGNRNGEHCFDDIKSTWPRKGIVRVEVIRNLNEIIELRSKIADIKSSFLSSKNSNVTEFQLKDVFLHGPSALPFELKKYKKFAANLSLTQNDSSKEKSTSNYFWIDIFFSATKFLFEPLQLDDEVFANADFDEEVVGEDKPTHDSFQNGADDFEIIQGENGLIAGGVPFTFISGEPSYIYVAEYSQHYGLLRLSSALRKDYNVPVLLVQLDADNEKCFGGWRNRLIMRNFIGYEETIMASLRGLAENETEKGYLRDIISGEHYHFITSKSSRIAYVTALFVMMIFTFAISMLLRFSHHQIFLFIIDILQMFELNQPIVFPIAPLLTVILALVGMEAIMSEIFNDTSTAFYVILLVWMADQYDVICCCSPVGRRFWLRFFYLYHFAFYVHQYRYSGQHGGLALLTSISFIFHSMIFFFHHYELPHIIYHERLHTIVSDFQSQQNSPSADSAAPSVGVNVATASEAAIAASVSESSSEDINGQIQRENINVQQHQTEDINFESNTTNQASVNDDEALTFQTNALEHVQNVDIYERVAQELVLNIFNDVFDAHTSDCYTDPNSIITPCL